MKELLRTNDMVKLSWLEALLADKDGEALCDRLLEIGVPAGAVQDTAQVLAHPHTAHRAMIAETDDGYRGWGDPIKMSRTPGGTRHRPPRFAQQGREILDDFGFSAEEIEALAEEGVLVEKRRR